MSDTADDFLTPNSAMADAIRAAAWHESPLGLMEGWPQSLRSALSICLGSGFPIAIYWGPSLALLYNDEWSPILGSKHPWALGRPAREVWPEIWDTIGPLFERVMASGVATRSKDQLLAMRRHGFVEECYFDYTFSPIKGEGGAVGGIFNAVVETTFRVIGARRTQVLSELSERLATMNDVNAVCAASMELLGSAAQDLCFAALYLPDASGDGRLRQFSLACGHVPENSVPTVFDTSVGDETWPVAAALASNQIFVLHDLDPTQAPILGTAWPEPCVQAALLPLPGAGAGRAAGLLVTGISPRLLLDTEYASFLGRVAAVVGGAIVRARSAEQKRERAQELARLDHAKTAFFSNVSHEFRTPLTLMLGPLSDLMDDPGLDEPKRRQVGMAQRNAARLSKLVNSLLEFTRLEAGRQQAVFRATLLGAFTADLASTFRSAIERAGLKFDVDCEDLSRSTFVDREMWEKIVLNLLSNALKFTFEGGIRIRLFSQASEAVLEVEDSGVGVPADELPRLFERFHRVEGARGRTHEGSGIGLALVQELVKLHGGSVSARSDVGKGTVFTVRLPLGSAHLPPELIGDANDAADGTDASVRTSTFVHEALRWLPEKPMSARSDAANESQSIPSGALPRIVVADDNADMRDYIRGLLENLYELVCVADGEEALAAIRSHRPDLLLSDVMMPRLDGFELLATLRADERLRDLPVVLLSARAGEDARVEGLSAGADDYLVKPFTARELLARVGATIELSRVRRRNEEQLRLGLSGGRMFTWDLDCATRQLRLSDNAQAILGPVSLPLSGIHELVEADDRPTHARRLEDAISNGVDLEDEMRVVRVDSGEARWIEIRARMSGAAEHRGPTLSGVAFDITVRKQMELALKANDQRKDEFLAMLAHELRNPLAPVRNAGELLLRIASADDRVRRAALIVNRQVFQLTRLVDDLLDVSRISRGRIELDKKPLDFASVIFGALESVDGLVREKRHRLSVVSAPTPVFVSGDAVRLQQCVVNVLTNAAKYTEGEGELQIEFGRVGAYAQLTVSDNGPGIAPDLLPFVFDLFVQSDRTLDRSQGGLGIGLSVVKRLVELHEGTVEARSAGAGQGATFIIRLPVFEGRPEEAAQVVAPVPVAARKVLVVDDSEDAAETLAMLLRAEGHAVEVVFDAFEAVSAARRVLPHVIFLDIGLPGIDGYEVARRLKAETALQDAMVVALTGYGQDEDRRRGEEAGFDHYLVKPAAVDMLNAVLKASRSG